VAVGLGVRPSQTRILDYVLGIFTVAASGLTLLSTLAAFRFSGFWPTCTSNILFYRGQARFSDLKVLEPFVGLPNAISGTIYYQPPFTLPFIDAMLRFQPAFDGWLGLGALYEFAGRLLPAGQLDSCQPIPLTGDVFPLALIGAIAIGLLTWRFFVPDKSANLRVALAGTTALGFLITIALVEYYTIVLFIVAVILLTRALISLLRKQLIPRWTVLVIVATNYPFVFAVDRGNLDTVAVAFLAGAAVLLTANRVTQVQKNLAAAALGFAVVLKLWPFYLAGALFRSRCGWGPWLTLGGTTALLVGLSAVYLSPYEVFVAWPLNLSQQDDLHSYWYLVFNYTIFGGLWYATVMVAGEQSLSVVQDFFGPLQGILVLLAPFLAMAVFLLRGPFHVIAGLSTTIFLMFTAASPPYRITVFVIIFGLQVHALTKMHGPPARIELVITFLLGLIIAPTYLWSLPGLTSLGVAPSGTLVGAVLLLALFAAFVRAWFTYRHAPTRWDTAAEEVEVTP